MAQTLQGEAKGGRAREKASDVQYQVLDRYLELFCNCPPLSFALFSPLLQISFLLATPPQIVPRDARMRENSLCGRMCCGSGDARLTGGRLSEDGGD
jgi:hypothetical protein